MDDINPEYKQDGKCKTGNTTKRRLIISDSETTESELEIVSDISEAEEKPRGRGRKPQDEQANELRKKRLVKKNIQKEIEKEMRIIAQITEKRDALYEKTPGASELDAEAIAQMHLQPSCTLAAEISRQLQVVENVEKKSGNLKGTYRRFIKDAVRTIRTAANVLTLRLDEDRPKAPGEDIEVIRRELQSFVRKMKRWERK